MLRVVEDERDAEERDVAPRASARRAVARRQPSEPLRSRAATPPSRARCVSASAAARSVAGPPCSTVSAALTTTTRSVSTSSRRDPNPRRGARIPERRIRRVVDRHPAVEAAARARASRARRSRARLARRARPHATRSVWRSVAIPSSSSASRHGGDREARGSPAVPVSGTRGGWTTIVARDAPRASASSGSPSSGKRSASRVAASTSVARPGAGGRRTTRVGGRGRDDERRSGEEGHARHLRIQPARSAAKYGLQRACRVLEDAQMADDERPRREARLLPAVRRRASRSRSRSASSRTRPATTASDADADAHDPGVGRAGRDADRRSRPRSLPARTRSSSSRASSATGRRARAASTRPCRR